MIKYCPTCPRSSDEARFIGAFCENCIIDGISASIPDTVPITVCRICGKVRTSKGFSSYNPANIAKMIKRELHNECSVSVESIENDRIAHAVFTCPVENTTESVKFSKPIKIRMSRQTCMKCIRRKTGYYQAIVQLRGSPGDVKKMKDSIDRFLERRDSFITKIVELRKGVDLYVEDKNKIKLFFEIHDKLKPKRTATLAGIKNGKRMYRHTYYVMLEPKEVQ